MDLTRLSVPQRLSLGSMAVIAISAFLPWVSIFGISVSGIEGDGVITLIVSLAGAGLLVTTAGVIGNEAKTPGKISQISLIVLAALVALVALIDMNGAAAIGLYLTMFAGLGWLVGAIWQVTTKVPDASQSGTV
jgi:hypothetical protein